MSFFSKLFGRKPKTMDWRQFIQHFAERIRRDCAADVQIEWGESLEDTVLQVGEGKLYLGNHYARYLQAPADLDAILAANAQDMEQAAQKGLNDALLDRLRLTEKTIDAMCEGLRQIAALPDPVGEMDEFRTRENGLQIGKMRVPLGVVGIIYESRPNVTVDAAALCLKSGNACVLRGGSEVPTQAPSLI